MAKQLSIHADCENFVAIDVVKGICRLSDQIVLIDSEVCSNFEQIPKCRACKFFLDADEQQIGKCTGLGKEYWIDGNYKASLCDGFKCE